MAITATAKSPVITGKTTSLKDFTALVATDQLVTRKNGVNDTDQDYTVPASKKADVRVIFIIEESAA